MYRYWVRGCWNGISVETQSIGSLTKNRGEASYIAESSKTKLREELIQLRTLRYV